MRYLLLAAVLFPVAGCKKAGVTTPAPATPVAAAKAAPTQPAAPPPQQSQPSGGGLSLNTSSPAAHAVRGKQNQNIRGDFKNLGLFYKQFETENGKAPANAQEFIAYIQRDHPSLCAAIKEGRYVLTLKSASGSSAIAYEKDIDLNKRRHVLFGDGRIEMLGDAETKAAISN